MKKYKVKIIPPKEIFTAYGDLQLPIKGNWLKRWWFRRQLLGNHNKRLR